MELIKISDFPTVSSPDEWFVVADTNGIARKISKENLKLFLGTVSTVGTFTIAITDPSPTIDGVYRPVEDGTYANAGGLVADLSLGINEFILNSGVWTRIITPVTQDKPSNYDIVPDIVNTPEGEVANLVGNSHCGSIKINLLGGAGDLALQSGAWDAVLNGGFVPIISITCSNPELKLHPNIDGDSGAITIYIDYNAAGAPDTTIYYQISWFTNP